MAAELVDRENSHNVLRLAHRIAPDTEIRTDAFGSMNLLSETNQHTAKRTSPEQVDEWLPFVHIVISKFKRFIMGTYHGVLHRYLQEHIDEFAYRFNRRKGKASCR